MREAIGRRIPIPVLRMLGRDRRVNLSPFSNVWRRRLFFKSSSSFTGHLSVEVGGATFIVSSRDGGVGEDVFSRALRPEFIVLPRAIESLGDRLVADGCLVDVGANIGTTAITAVARYGFGDAVAIEPSPENALLLRLNCVVNGLEDRVRVVEAAVSDREGPILFDLTPDPGAHQVAVAGHESGQTAEVAGVTLDGLVERGVIDPAAVQLVWVDAQGHEAHVVAGAERLLSSRPALVVAVRRQKLASQGELGAFAASIERHYDWIVDLRVHGLQRPGFAPIVQPVSEIHAILEAPRTTDVLAFADRR